jgi:hypothetical protein
MNSKEAKRLEIANVIAGLTLLLVAIVCLHLAERHGAQAWTAETHAARCGRGVGARNHRAGAARMTWPEAIAYASMMLAFPLTAWAMKR